MSTYSHVVNFYNSLVTRNSDQIQSKARLFKVEREEVENELFILVANRLDDFDVTKGSAEAFFFGCLHAALKRHQFDPSYLAIPIDDDCEPAISFANHKDCYQDESALCFTSTNGKIAAGKYDLLSLALAASGKTITEMAAILGITPRRLNQILKKRRGDSGDQFSLPFDGSGK